YTIAGIRAGDYEVRVSSVGYTAQTFKVIISSNQTTKLNATLSSGEIIGREVIVTDTRVVKPEKVGTQHTIRPEDLDRSTRTNVVSAIALENSVQSAGQNGFGIRGGRTNETSLQMDGVEISDPISGGFGQTSASFFPTVSTLAVQEVQV